MAALGPWENAPVLAVAVSGGADSLALALLADHWARAREGQGGDRGAGRVVGLVVDHDLRPTAAEEATATVNWLKALNIDTHLLRWSGAKPDTRIQERARAARYHLLEAWCARAGVLHLLVAHHRDDQIETVRLRAAAGSTDYGLAAMPAVTWRRHIRLLRPLLDWSKSELLGLVHAAGLSFHDDPSNRDPRFARARLRDAPLDDAAAAALLSDTRTRARDRRAREAAAAALLGRHVRVHPAAWVDIDPALLSAPAEAAALALARVATTIGGGTYDADGDVLLRLARDLWAGEDETRRTLGGCLLFRATERLILCREPGRAADPKDLSPGRPVVWDRRFRVTARGPWPSGGRLSVGALGEDGWRAIRASGAAGQVQAMPHPVRLSLPAVWCDGALVAAPHFGANLPFANHIPAGCGVDIAWTPPRPLATAPFGAARPASESATDPAMGDAGIV